MPAQAIYVGMIAAMTTKVASMAVTFSPMQLSQISSARLAKVQILSSSPSRFRRNFCFPSFS